MEAVAKFKEMKTWTDRLGRTKLRTFTDKEGHFWLEQNAAKASRWGKLARKGHEIAWEFAGPGGGYTSLVGGLAQFRFALMGNDGVSLGDHEQTHAGLQSDHSDIRSRK
jgi:hypothetical protein